MKERLIEVISKSYRVIYGESSVRDKGVQYSKCICSISRMWSEPQVRVLAGDRQVNARNSGKWGYCDWG